MDALIINCWTIFGLLTAILLSKIISPKISYDLKISLILGCVGAIIFAGRFLYFLTSELSLWPIIFSIFFCGICLNFIYLGGKKVQYKTMTAVFSNINGKPIGTMFAGSLNWADPIFEKVTISVDGTPNISADLQELEIMIPSTDRMHTKEPGIQAKVKKINFMLELDTANAGLLFDIEGGPDTITERIISFIDEFLIDKTGEIIPEDLDRDRGNTLRNLGDDLKQEVNNFCAGKYPYEIVDKVNIGDIELDEVYYTALSKKKLAELEQKARDTEAKSLSARLKLMGKKSLPNGSEAEQLYAAQVNLGIVKREDKKNTISVDKETGQILTGIANIFKN